MLKQIPFISSKVLNTHFCSIDSKLSDYEAKLSAFEGLTMLRNRFCLDDDTANFVYTGQENVQDGVIHVRVHPSIRVIRAKAFSTITVD